MSIQTLPKSCSLFIGVPSMEMVHAEFCSSLMGLALYVRSVNLPEPWKLTGFKYHNRRHSVLPKLREDLVDLAIETKATHLLFIDSDMKFPPALFHRLLAWDVDCVAINCALKNDVSAFTARRLNAETGAREEVWTHPPGENKILLEKVWQIGTGIMLLKTSLLKKISTPRFPVSYNHKNKTYTGEDWNFVTAIHKAGFSVYVDHELSWEVGHIGNYEYTPNLVWNRILIEKQSGKKLKGQAL